MYSLICSFTNSLIVLTMKKIIILFLALACLTYTYAQERDLIQRTFKSTRVINTHSVETLQKNKLDFRVGHRFGDLAGDAGGWATFYGLENAADVLIGFEYGVSDRLTLGISRSKGAGPHRALVNGQVKYRALWQNDKMPVSVTLLAGTGISTMQGSENPEALNRFDKTAHRFSYVYQAHIARKFSDRFSLQITPSYIHRNVTAFGIKNDLFSIGAATRIQLSKVYALLVDITAPFSEQHSNGDFTLPVGFGLEIDTGGHIFQINLTNAGGMAETDYIPYTTSLWGEGQFRLGFTISRLFNL